MRILALDIATKTGFAHSSGFNGVESFALRHNDSPGMRFIYFKRWLTECFTYPSAKTDFIVYEQPIKRHLSMAAAHVSHGLIATLEQFAAEQDIEVTCRTPTAIKDYALGKLPKGMKKNKGRMTQAADNRWPGLDILDDNHADALHLYSMVHEEFKIPNQFDELYGPRTS